jgi:nicotinate-nucleotide adenylyltransferase
VNKFLKSWQKKRSRVVVFAGVFDPVHKGHISAAEDALKFGSRVVFLPEKTPQHKHSTTEYKHRFEMLQIATKLQLNMEVINYPREQQYIKETFEWLNIKFPEREFIWLVGSDVVPYIDKWQDSENLKSYGVVQILTYLRGDDEFEKLPIKVKDVPVYIRKRSRKMLNHQNMSSSYILDDFLHRQSSLPKGVYEYIKTNKLYSVSDSAPE